MSKLLNIIKQDIYSIKETSWATILIFSILYCIYVTFINLVVFKSNILAPISRVTFGLISQTLIVNLASIVIFVFLLMLVFGRLVFFDIGIRKNKLPAAITAISVLWISIQLLNIIISLIISGKPIISKTWSEYGVSSMFGNFIGQLFGNCLFEEIAFRGFLLVQICKKFKAGKRPLLTGIVVSQMIFALIHIPNRILGGMSILQILPSLIIVFILGVLFAAVYLITDNLFLAIGVHALWNTPLLVFDGIPGFAVILIFMLILPIIWDKTLGRLGSKSSSSYKDMNRKL